jgi:hypothetical protein|tara:strand:+ start:1362 stop:1628 length:267 start_codon:yes stop_codon:yes gene_type:complete
MGQDNEDKTDDIQAVYAAVQGFSHNIMGKMGIDPLVVAAVLASTALSIYKTTLSPEDFDNIVEAIAESRGSVKDYHELMASGPNKTIH